jgi:O-antigen/teichoic acid export membrane protein
VEKKSISKTKASVINLLFNYANAIFAIVTGLVFVPLYLHYFSVSTYGSYLSSGNIVSMLGLLEGGTAMVITQKLATSYAKKDLKTFSNLVGAGLFISFTIMFILIAVGFCLAPFISAWVKAEPAQYKNIQYAFIFAACGAGLSLAFSNISAIFQAWLKVHISGMVNLISIAIGISATLIGLRLGLGVISIPLGLFIRGLFGVITLLICLVSILVKEKYPAIGIQKQDCTEVIKSTLPMFGTLVAKSVVTNSQLLLITNFINPVASAIFFITGRIYTVCEYFLAPIGSSIYSSISHLVGESNDEKLKFNIIRIFILFSAFSVIVITGSFALNKTFISVWLGHDKFGGESLSALLCLAMLFSSRFRYLEFNLYALGIFGKTILFDTISSGIRIILILILIRYIGNMALPLAEILSTSLLLGYYINKLLIDRIGMNTAESVKFVFAGFISFSAAFIVAYMWSLYVPSALNFTSFIGQAVLIGIIIATIVFLLTKEVRTTIFGIVSVLKKKSIKIPTDNYANR